MKFTKSSIPAGCYLTEEFEILFWNANRRTMSSLLLILKISSGESEEKDNMIIGIPLQFDIF